MREDFIAPDGSEHHIEFLCDGQQIIVDGIHTDTYQPYRWINGDMPPWDALVEITEAYARELFESCCQFIEARPLCRLGVCLPGFVRFGVRFGLF
jgi:hypothetical protein